MKRLLFSVACIAHCLSACDPITAQEAAAIAATEQKPTDEQAIIETIRTYVDAYNKKDASVVASHWAPNAVLVALDSGERIVGRDAIKTDFERQFADQPNSQLEVDVSSIRLVTDSVAVEEGFATILGGDYREQTSYTVVHVKQKDGWKIDSVRETVLPGQSAPQLSDLNWLVGSWTDTGEESTVEFKVKWARNERFLTMNFRVTSQDAPPLEGTQIIGVDPASKRIRSWLFDSDGGIGQGDWTTKDGSWIAEMKMTLPGGDSASATNVYTPVDANSYKWKSMARRVSGELLPDIAEVVVTRAP